MNTRQLLAWTDRDARRRRNPWPLRVLVAGGLVALVWHGGLGMWHVAITAAFAVAMIGTALAIFWRPDAALLARLPLTGPVLLRAAVVRATRTAVLTGAMTALAAAPLYELPPAILLRGLALIGTLVVVTAAFIPAAAAAAALTLASARATQLSGTDRIPTTVLGALPGTAAALAVILAIAVRWWIPTGETTAAGPALLLLGIALVVSVGALASVLGHAHGMSIALREVAALDRQRLAHLEIHPPRGLERLVAGALPRAGSLEYARIARLVRRRYPMAWVVGFVAYLVAIPLAIWPAGATWPLGVAIATGAYALVLARRLARPPIELARPALPTAAALPTARIAWILLYVAVFAAAPTALATRGVSGSDALVALGTIAIAALASAVVAARR